MQANRKYMYVIKKAPIHMLSRNKARNYNSLSTTLVVLKLCYGCNIKL